MLNTEICFKCNIKSQESQKCQCPSESEVWEIVF